jgi:acid phosphatase
VSYALHLTLGWWVSYRFDGYSSQVFTRLAVGRLIGDLTTALEDRVSGRSPLRLAVYSAHDTSLGALLCGLDAFDRRWPPFTSHVEIELLRKGNQDASSSSSSSHSSSSASSSSSSSWGNWLGMKRSSTEVDGDGAAPRKDHYVRVRYNGQTVRLPGCAAHDKHYPGTDGEVCTLDAFMDVAKKASITQAEWERECSG